LGAADATAAAPRTIAAASASSILIDIFASWDATAHGRKRMRRWFTALAATLILSTAFSAVAAAAAPVGIALEDTARLKILSEVLAVSEAGLAYVFESLQSAGLIAREQPFDFAKIVDQRYLVQSRVLQDRGTVRR
jgi:hypothetical protein